MSSSYTLRQVWPSDRWKAIRARGIKCRLSVPNSMTEALNASQISFLRRAAAAGHVSVETDEDRKTLDELIEKKLIIGNQLTDAGWTELGNREDQ